MTTVVDEHRSDFDLQDIFDGAADILWRDQAGHDVLWLMSNNVPTFGSGSVAVLPNVTPDWHFKAAVNFEVGGDADIVWQNDNGALALWQMNGPTVSAIHALPNPGSTWHVVGGNDFGGTTVAQILFQHDSGALAMWAQIDPATGTVAGMGVGTQNPGPAWHVVGTGDTDDDLRAGILWQNDNGALALWENATFAGNTFTFNTIAALPTVDASWHVKGMADVSGDSRADVVFQNDNGAVVVWQLGGAAGTTLLAQTPVVNLDPGPTWHIVGLRDMDGDGQADILFQNDDGAAAVWEHYGQAFGFATFTALAISPNPNPNGHVWDLL